MSTSPTQKPITRIDLEAIGDGYVRVSFWREGWIEGNTPDSLDMAQGAIFRLLMEYEKQGFTCEMCDPSHGRALRGQIARIDFEKILNVWHVRKFPYGWTAKTRPLSDTVKTELEITEAVMWCESHKWTVSKRDGQIRAWKGEAKPVHAANTIRNMRRRAEENQRDYGTDFAYMG